MRNFQLTLFPVGYCWHSAPVAAVHGEGHGPVEAAGVAAVAVEPVPVGTAAEPEPVAADTEAVVAVAAAERMRPYKKKQLNASRSTRWETSSMNGKLHSAAAAVGEDADCTAAGVADTVAGVVAAAAQKADGGGIEKSVRSESHTQEQRKPKLKTGWDTYIMAGIHSGGHTLPEGHCRKAEQRQG